MFPSLKKLNFNLFLDLTKRVAVAQSLNKSFTFNKSKSGLIRFFIFIILYFSTLLINVASNEFVLDLTGRGKSSFIIAFIAATFLSATLNFIGMKYVVFNSAKWFEK